MPSQPRVLWVFSAWPTQGRCPRNTLGNVRASLPRWTCPTGPSPRALPRVTQPAGPVPGSRGYVSSTWPEYVAAGRTFRFGVTFNKRKLRRLSVARGGCAGQRGPRSERPKRSHRCSRRRLNASENPTGRMLSALLPPLGSPRGHRTPRRPALSLALPAHHQPPPNSRRVSGSPAGGGTRGLAEGHSHRQGGHGGSPSYAGLSS